MTTLIPREEALQMAVEAAYDVTGNILEFGVYQGESTSLNPEFAQRVGRVALASLDADLFSSTLCGLTWLTPLLGIGSLLLFDEYLGEGGAEKRAHEQWQEATGIHTEEVFRHERVPVLETPDERVLFWVTGGGHLAATPLPNSRDL
jgi:hypothetical protein